MNRMQYAQLLSQGDTSSRARAVKLLEECHSEAARMGMAPLVAAAERLQKTL
jgi:hypothetical protein